VNNTGIKKGSIMK